MPAHQSVACTKKPKMNQTQHDRTPFKDRKGCPHMFEREKTVLLICVCNKPSMDCWALHLVVSCLAAAAAAKCWWVGAVWPHSSWLRCQTLLLCSHKCCNRCWDHIWPAETGRRQQKVIVIENCKISQLWNHFLFKKMIFSSWIIFQGIVTAAWVLRHVQYY